MITSVWTTPGQENEVARELFRAVFCQELGMDEAQLDDAFTPFSFHLALVNDGMPIAAGRFYLRGVGKAELSRICVLPEYRRQGIGDGLIKVLDFKAALAGLDTSYAEVPEEYEKIFLRIGFAPEGDWAEKNGRRVRVMKKETNDGTKGHCAHQ